MTFLHAKANTTATLISHDTRHDPTHRRRGAASLLIEWGTQRADERGLKCVLMASEAGFGAYLKHGFKVVREVEMDLRPYGVEATELRRWMIREPVAR
jgi:GNAT superfamily N-acetyltransferase